MIICALQSYGITVYINQLNENMGNTLIENAGFGFVALTILAITTGTLVLMWMGELMTEKGIGNGISLLIFAGIISGAPPALKGFWSDVQSGDRDMILVLILLVAFVFMIGLSIVLTEGTRKIPLQYGKKVVGRRIMQGASQTLPIKVNAANVMPIIFASSLMLFPRQIAQYLQGNYPEFASHYKVPATTITELHVDLCYHDYILCLLLYCNSIQSKRNSRSSQEKWWLCAWYKARSTN